MRHPPNLAFFPKDLIEHNSQFQNKPARAWDLELFVSAVLIARSCGIYGLIKQFVVILQHRPVSLARGIGVLIFYLLSISFATAQLSSRFSVCFHLCTSIVFFASGPRLPLIGSVTIGIWQLKISANNIPLRLSIFPTSWQCCSTLYLFLLCLGHGWDWKANLNWLYSI